MKVRNFFDEDIDVDSDDPEIEKQIEKRYGIPLQCQSIYRKGRVAFLSLKKTCELSSDTRKHMPEEYAELGCTQERFNFYYNRYGEDAKKHMLPFLSTVDKKQNVFFKRINKANLDDIDTFIKNIDEKEQNLIISHVEEYIYAFLNDG